MTIEQLKNFIVSTFRIEDFDEKEDKIIFKYFEMEFELNFDYINSLLTELGTYNQEETELYNNYNYEILTRDASRVFYGREREQELRDEVNGLTYFHCKASDRYILYLLDKVLKEETNTPARRYFDPMRFRRMRTTIRREENSQIELFPFSILEFIKESLVRFDTITIKSTKPLTKSAFEQYSYSYIFSLSYNLSYTIYPLRFFDEFFSTYRIGRIRRNSAESIEPPKRLYVNDLILHYQKGLSSESLDHQYLSFYHIIEHFFEKIYNEDLLNKVKSELTKPGFSYKKKTDIETLIKIVQSRTKIQREEFQVNELEALELTLKKYIIDLNEVKIELEEIDVNLLEYFKTTEVPFSKGNKVNFELTPDEIIKSLTRRIYSTRNSIVHSKETEKQKYTPFKDDKDLIPEIYLMRILTEKIILNNSKEI